MRVTPTTLLLVYITTGELKAPVFVALFEIIVKTSIYYFHERAWEQVDNEKEEEEIREKAS